MMLANELLHAHLREECDSIYETRLDAVMDVALGLQKSNNLSLTKMGRCMPGNMDVKHKIKKVDRLEGNKHLHQELHKLYMGLSSFVFALISHDKTVPMIVDLCFVKDDTDIQMLSAEVASKGRTIPIYREVFGKGELQGRADDFLRGLKKCLPTDRKIIIIMDAGFHEDWFSAIEMQNWYWICRTRIGKDLLLPGETEWKAVKDFIKEIGIKTRNYDDVLLTQKHQRKCRIVTTRKDPSKKRIRKIDPKKRNRGSGSYLRAEKEPWILATNLPKEFTSTKIISYYGKRMQIEESFRDMKSHQYGLAGRCIRTKCIERWGVKMLLAAIVQITYWIIGVIAHSQGKQILFQANTVKDRKVFSYFTLGKMMIEFDKLDTLIINLDDLPRIIQEELAFG